jgi:hypothetical protein
MGGWQLPRFVLCLASHCFRAYVCICCVVLLSSCSVDGTSVSNTAAAEAVVDFAHVAQKLRFGSDTPEKCKQAFKQMNDADSKQLFPKDKPLVVGAPCFGEDSIGNSLSVYLEGRICAMVAGLTYVSAPKVEPGLHSLANHSFFRGLPSIAEPSGEFQTPPEMNQAMLGKLCPCQSICHEWNYGLMHKHMPVAGNIFRNAVDAFWAELSSDRKNELQFQSLRADSGSKIAWRGNKIDIDNRLKTTEKDELKEIGLFPAIPDVAVHYRCGDNVVTHYGFLPFGAMKCIISDSDRTIYILAEHPSRRTDQRRKERCQHIFDGLLTYLMKHFPNAVIVLLRGHDMFEDLARLTYAKKAICSVSTFCLWPAVGSNTSAYFPITKLIAKEDVSFNYGPSFHWIKDNKYRVLRGLDTTHMTDADVLRYLSRE